MATACSICIHPRVEGINSALLAGRRVAEVARQFAVHDDALRRHRINEHHVPDVSPDEREAARVAAKGTEDSIREFARKLRIKAASLLMKAENSGRLAVALQGVREARACLELEGKLEGDLATAPMTQVNVSIGDTQATAIAILAALRDEPTARQKVLAALSGAGGLAPLIEGGAVEPLAIEAGQD